MRRSLRSPSSTLALRNRLRLSKPGSYYFGASGGLGFGIAAAVGVQLAQHERPVVCVLGEGSAQYGITALWTAVAYNVPVTFLVLRNEEYMILKWFAALEQVAGVPGLELPGLDVAAVAQGYGMRSRSVVTPEELTHALREDIAVDDGPRLAQAPVDVARELETQSFDAYLSSNRTCEAALQDITGRPYNSFVIALEKVTRR